MKKIHIFTEAPQKVKRNVLHKIEREKLIMTLCAIRYLPFEEVKNAVAELENIHIETLVKIAGFGNNNQFQTALEALYRIESERQIANPEDH